MPLNPLVFQKSLFGLIQQFLELLLSEITYIQCEVKLGLNLCARGLGDHHEAMELGF